jgi:hypothetical protein
LPLTPNLTYFPPGQEPETSLPAHKTQVADATNDDLQFYQQLGVEWAMVNIRDAEQHSLDFYKRLVKRFGEYGIKIYRITNLGVHNVPEITLNLPGRDKRSKSSSSSSAILARQV